MIYAHKPQRSGRSIAANTNNPPQDPPPPKDILPIPPVTEPIVEPITEPIVEPTPEPIIPKITKAPKTIKVPKITKAPKTVITTTIKVPKTPRFAFLHNIIAKIKIFFKRGK